MQQEPESEDTVFVIDEPANEWVSVAALQCRLRELFATKPLNRALAIGLQNMAELMQADYAVVHARYGNTPLSEEWSREEYELGDALREAVNTVMVEASDADQARCVRLSADQRAGAVVAAVLYDDGHQQAGSVGFVFRDCGRAKAYEILVQIESLVGFLALLLSARGRPAGGKPNGSAASSAPLTEPARLLLQVASEVGNRHGLDQVAIGIVRGKRVRVALMNGETEPRAANPGVRLLRAAMEECLDHGDRVTASGDPAVAEHRLHAAWLAERGGGAVASLPLVFDDRPVAIVSVASGDPHALDGDKLEMLGRDVAAYPPLVHVSRLATRSLGEHCRDAARAAWQHWGGERRRRLFLIPLLAAVLAWLAIGELPYSLTVPCTVAAADRRTISSPRDGILADYFVRPGDQVRTGQLLAELDHHEDRLAKVELDFELQALDAQLDRALAEHDAGMLRVLEAQRAGMTARLAIVERRIEQARIRAPQDGIVLQGDLRQRLGSRLALGDALFELARTDAVVVQLRIPEQAVLDARQTVKASVVVAADPGTPHPLRDLRIAPASTVTDGQNNFVGEAEADASVWRVAPGSEGFAMLDVGRRRVWWVLGHRVMDWLRLNFWI